MAGAVTADFGCPQASSFALALQLAEEHLDR